MNKEFKFLTEGLVILCFNSDIFTDVSLFLKNSFYWAVSLLNVFFLHPVLS